MDSALRTEGEDSSAETPASAEVDDGKTIVVTKPKEGDAAVAMPRFLLIETPPEEALTHLIEVQNSNCFGGG